MMSTNSRRRETEVHGCGSILQNGNATIAVILAFVVLVRAGKEEYTAVIFIAIILDGKFYGLVVIYEFVTCKCNICRF